MTAHHATVGHNGGPALDQPRKAISIVVPVSVTTLLKHAWGASHRAGSLTDQELVKAWSYSHAAKVMQSMGISPKGYVQRTHHHIRPQIADNNRIAVLNDEMERRGLFDLYEVDISIRRTTDA